MWIAQSDLRCFWLHKLARRSRASCNMQLEPDDLIGWCMQRSQYYLYRLEDLCLVTWFWGGQEQDTLSTTWGNWFQVSLHTPDTACLLYVAPHLMVEASVNTTACLETCSKGTLAKRNGGSDHGMKVWQQTSVICTRWIPVAAGHSCIATDRSTEREDGTRYHSQMLPQHHKHS